MNKYIYNALIVNEKNVLKNEKQTTEK